MAGSRSKPKDEDLRALANDIQATGGLLNALVLVHVQDDDKYHLVTGLRRLLALKLLYWDGHGVPCQVFDVKTEEEAIKFYKEYNKHESSNRG